MLLWHSLQSVEIQLSKVYTEAESEFEIYNFLILNPFKLLSSKLIICTYAMNFKDKYKIWNKVTEFKRTHMDVGP